MKEFHELPYEERKDMLDRTYKFLHENHHFQGNAWNDLPKIALICQQGHFHSLLDYGCGEDAMIKRLGQKAINQIFNSRLNLRARRKGRRGGRPFRYSLYDPYSSNPNIRREPKQMSDLVVVNDVLEHLLPEDVDSTLDHIFSLAKKAIWVNISTVPASKMLEDETGILFEGQSVHTCIRPDTWWRVKLEKAESRCGRPITLHIHFDKG